MKKKNSPALAKWWEWDLPIASSQHGTSEFEIDSLRGRDVDIGAYKENAVGRESDDVVERPFPHIDHLQYLSSARAEQPRLLYDEQLFFLRRPQ